jgi:hypothetical protein
MKESVDHADSQHKESKKSQQKYGLSQHLIGGIHFIQKRYHTGTIDFIEII